MVCPKSDCAFHVTRGLQLRIAFVHVYRKRWTVSVRFQVEGSARVCGKRRPRPSIQSLALNHVGQPGNADKITSFRLHFTTRRGTVAAGA